MIAPLFAASLFCATPKLKDETKTSWTQTDQETLLQAQKEGCKRHNPQTPCLITFVKLGENEYSVICGQEQRRKDD